MTAERRGGKAPASAEERTQERSDKRGRERERLRLTNGAKAPLDGSPPAKRRRGGSTAEGEARTGAGARRKGNRTLRQDGRTRNSTDRATRLLLKKIPGGTAPSDRRAGAPPTEPTLWEIPQGISGDGGIKRSARKKRQTEHFSATRAPITETFCFFCDRNFPRCAVNG